MRWWKTWGRCWAACLMISAAPFCSTISANELYMNNYLIYKKEILNYINVIFM
jgi:hypothetical protein